MKNRILLFFFLFQFLFFTNLVIAQKHKTDSVIVNRHKNVIQVSGGLGLILTSGTINYERTLHQAKKRRFVPYVSLGYGIYESYTDYDDGKCFIERFGILTGKGKRHFEANIGVYVLQEDYGYYFSNNHWQLAPTIYIGHRYQKPNGFFVFKAGIAVPGGFSMSLGTSF